MHLTEIIFLACHKSKTIVLANQQHLKNLKAAPLAGTAF
jgi:hypothetical protein